MAGDLDSLLLAIAALAGSGAATPDSPAAPNLEGVVLAAEGLRARATAEEPAWWDAIRGGVKLAGLDLRGISLHSTDLSGANLGGSDLSGAKGTGVRLQGAHLEEARFDGADLAGADLGGAKAGEASFDEAMLEDASLADAGLRFASLRKAILDGANLDGADLWGARLDGAEANNASLRGARLDEASLAGADLSGADLENASLRRANLRGAKLNGANLRGVLLDGAQLDEADLSSARLPLVALTGCGLRHVRFAGAWLERTQMRADQLGGAIGEEVAGEFDPARDGYTVLEQNFNTLGDSDAASWAYRRRRRMGKREARRRARASVRERRWRSVLGNTATWLSDAFAEWLCDYGESLPRVARALTVVLLAFAVFYGATGSLVPKDGMALPAGLAHSVVRRVAELLLYSLVSMTTVGTGDLGLRPSGDLVYLAASVQSIVGTVLLGLFGFVLGNRLRR